MSDAQARGHEDVNRIEESGLDACKTGERILSVVFYPDLGLCIELGDEKIDDDGIYGYAPREVFLKALKEEIHFHIENTIGGLGDHPALGRVLRRVQQGIEKRHEAFDGPRAHDNR